MGVQTWLRGRARLLAMELYLVLAPFIVVILAYLEDED